MTERGLKLDKSGRLVLTEKDVTDQIIGRLCADGFGCYKLDVGVDAMSGREYGEPGMVDFLIVYERRFAFIELKCPGASPKRHQHAWMAAAARRGHYVNWWDSYDTANGGRRPFLADYPDLRRALGREEGRL